MESDYIFYCRLIHIFNVKVVGVFYGIVNASKIVVG